MLKRSAGGAPWGADWPNLLAHTAVLPRKEGTAAGVKAAQERARQGSAVGDRRGRWGKMRAGTVPRHVSRHACVSCSKHASHGRLRFQLLQQSRQPWRLPAHRSHSGPAPDAGPHDNRSYVPQTGTLPAPAACAAAALLLAPLCSPGPAACEELRTRGRRGAQAAAARFDHTTSYLMYEHCLARARFTGRGGHYGGAGDGAEHCDDRSGTKQKT
jgi:hypothetical protein